MLSKTLTHLNSNKPTEMSLADKGMNCGRRLAFP